MKYLFEFGEVLADEEHAQVRESDCPWESACLIKYSAESDEIITRIQWNVCPSLMKSNLWKPVHLSGYAL